MSDKIPAPEPVAKRLDQDEKEEIGEGNQAVKDEDDDDVPTEPFPPNEDASDSDTPTPSPPRTRTADGGRCEYKYTWHDGKQFGCHFVQDFPTVAQLKIAVSLHHGPLPDEQHIYDKDGCKLMDSTRLEEGIRYQVQVTEKVPVLVVLQDEQEDEDDQDEGEDEDDQDEEFRVSAETSLLEFQAWVMDAWQLHPEQYSVEVPLTGPKGSFDRVDCTPSDNCFSTWLKQVVADPAGENAKIFVLRHTERAYRCRFGKKDFVCHVSSSSSSSGVSVAHEIAQQLGLYRVSPAGDGGDMPVTDEWVLTVKKKRLERCSQLVLKDLNHITRLPTRPLRISFNQLSVVLRVCEIDTISWVAGQFQTVHGIQVESLLVPKGDGSCLLESSPNMTCGELKGFENLDVPLFLEAGPRLVAADSLPGSLADLNSVPVELPEMKPTAKEERLVEILDALDDKKGGLPRFKYHQQCIARAEKRTAEVQHVQRQLRDIQFDVEKQEGAPPSVQLGAILDSKKASLAAERDSERQAFVDETAKLQDTMGELLSFKGVLEFKRGRMMQFKGSVNENEARHQLYCGQSQVPIYDLHAELQEARRLQQRHRAEQTALMQHEYQDVQEKLDSCVEGARVARERHTDAHLLFQNHLPDLEHTVKVYNTSCRPPFYGGFEKHFEIVDPFLAQLIEMVEAALASCQEIEKQRKENEEAIEKQKSLPMLERQLQSLDSAVKSSQKEVKKAFHLKAVFDEEDATEDELNEAQDKYNRVEKDYQKCCSRYTATLHQLQKAKHEFFPELNVPTTFSKDWDAFAVRRRFKDYTNVKKHPTNRRIYYAEFQGKPCVLKEHMYDLDHRDVLREQITRELRVRRRLGWNEGIACPETGFIDGGALYLQYRVYDGSLGEFLDEKERIPQRTLPLESLPVLAFKIVDAVLKLHEYGIYHGDLKPDNVLMLAMSPALTDFTECSAQATLGPPWSIQFEIPGWNEVQKQAAELSMKDPGLRPSLKVVHAKFVELFSTQTSELGQAREEKKKLESEVQRELAQREEDIQEVRFLLASVNDEKEGLSADLAQAEHEYREKKAKMDALEDQHKELQSQHAEQAVQSEEKQRELDQRQQVVEQLRTEVSTGQQRCSALDGKLSAREDEVKRLKDEIGRKEQEHEKDKVQLKQFAHYDTPKYWLSSSVGGVGRPNQLVPSLYAKQQLERNGLQKIKTVHRNENVVLFRQYAVAREKVRKELDSHSAVPTAQVPGKARPSPAYSRADMAPHCEWIDGLSDELGVNEVYLLHCTNRAAAESILHHGFNRSYSGDAAGTRFGHGCYFSSYFEKASAYLKGADPVLLVVRVILGFAADASNVSSVATLRRAPPLPASMGKGYYDSVIHVNTANKANEYIIFDDTCMFPECLVELDP